MANALKAFIATMTPDELAAFAERAGSSPGAIRLAAQGYKTGRLLAVSPEFAARLEQADTTGTLLREEMSPTCAKCPYSGANKPTIERNTK